MVLPKLFKGIALFTPAGDVVYCVDPVKQNRWHIHLCIALQETLGLPEPPHFLVPCYTATIDRWLNPQTQEVETAAEAYPLVWRYRTLLNVLFETEDSEWKTIVPTEGVCDAIVLTADRQHFAPLWKEQDLVLRLENSSLNQASLWEKPLTKPMTLLKTELESDVKSTSSEQNQIPAQGYVLRLFVSGTSIYTEKILNRLHQLLEKSVNLPYTLQVIDVLKHPEQAEMNQISATPTLMRIWPHPIRKIVGELEDEKRILHVLGS